MQTVIFIPARYQSQRFPGKPLAVLEGATGEKRTLIERSWQAAMAVERANAVYVLTDDERIAETARGFGADVLMTSSEARNGTERCALGMDALETAPDVVINLQGDAPLTPPHYVDALIDAMVDPSVQMATPVLETDADHLAKLQADRRADRVGATTAVFGVNGDALYFSKEIVPFYDNAPAGAVPVYHHIGCYAYREGALRRYAKLAPGVLEAREGLEQLRFLEHGVPVRCVKVDARGRSFWELNNPSDIPLIEEIMKREELA